MNLNKVYYLFYYSKLGLFTHVMFSLGFGSVGNRH